MIDILTIKYWNKIEIMNEQDVISYEDGNGQIRIYHFHFQSLIEISLIL